MLRTAICVFIAVLAGKSATAEESSSAPVFGAPGVFEHRMVFRVGDQGLCDRVSAGAWDLAGKKLEIVYADRITPHEASEFNLFDGVEKLTGEFAEVRLPEGDRCEMVYDRAAGRITVRNFRPDRAPAFPGAEGFGKYTKGGRGGRVIAVTNLDDRGPGSFREACEAEGPRTVVFRVSGTIALESPIKIRHPYITIAGQTAPGGGVCVKNYQVSFNTSHLIVRHMRFRPGDEMGREHDGFGGDGDHIIVDHCSVSWSVDEALSINKASNVTVQWCLISESLWDSVHKKGKHGYGGIWGGPGGSFHHNLLAHHSSRNPRVSGNPDSGLADVRNNVIYNWGFNSAYGGEMWGRNWINNFYKFGPATGEKVRNRIFLQQDPRGKMYCDGNFVWGFPEVSTDNWDGGVQFVPDGEATPQTLRMSVPYVVAPVATDLAALAYERVLNDAGASLRRDAVDARIVEEVRSGTARFGRSYGGGGKGIIDSAKDVGGWPELKGESAPADSDGDGMPDDWETAQGLDAADPADGAREGADGYTALERYLNALVAQAPDRATDVGDP